MHIIWLHVNFNFSDSVVFICDFHREQAWERWLAKKGNGCSDIKQEALAKLQRMARASTDAECKAAEEGLRNWKIWNDPAKSKLVDYIQRYWLSIKKVRFW